jgi:hypothetical protein
MQAELTFASTSVARHLARGATGFGLIIGSFALTPVVGPVALLGTIGGFVALRGCPMCWMIGLGETISRGRIQRTCVDGSCTIANGAADETAPSASVAA